MEMESLKKYIFNFRNVIMTKDYLGDLYKKFGHAIDFRD